MNSLTWEFMQLNKIKDTKIESSIKNYFIYYATVFINDVNGSKCLENIKKLNEIYNLELWLEYFDDDGQLINIDKVVGFCDIYNIEYNEKYNEEILYSYLKEKRANMCNLTI